MRKEEDKFRAGDNVGSVIVRTFPEVAGRRESAEAERKSPGPRDKAKSAEMCREKVWYSRSVRGSSAAVSHIYPSEPAATRTLTAALGRAPAAARTPRNAEPRHIPDLTHIVTRKRCVAMS